MNTIIYEASIKLVYLHNHAAVQHLSVSSQLKLSNPRYLLFSIHLENKYHIVGPPLAGESKSMFTGSHMTKWRIEFFYLSFIHIISYRLLMLRPPSGGVSTTKDRLIYNVYLKQLRPLLFARCEHIVGSACCLDMRVLTALSTSCRGCGRGRRSGECRGQTTHTWATSQQATRCA